MPGHIPWDFLAKFLYEERELGARADHAHVAQDHVEKLRQLVEGPGADEAADLGAPRVSPRRSADLTGQMIAIGE